MYAYQDGSIENILSSLLAPQALPMRTNGMGWISPTYFLHLLDLNELQSPLMLITVHTVEAMNRIEKKDDIASQPALAAPVVVVASFCRKLDGIEKCQMDTLASCCLKQVQNQQEFIDIHHSEII